ncbi:MAG: hypothetical protein HY791_36580 [Deltaproteobacteria bacterium]|nr:hypothetical protein [Deltaproteobacteria bacterium]
MSSVRSSGPIGVGATQQPQSLGARSVVRAESQPTGELDPTGARAFAKQFGPQVAGPRNEAAGPRAPVSKGWLETLVEKATGRGNAPIDGVQLPAALHARLEADQKSWRKHGVAPGPMYVNGDLARIRYVDKKDPKSPETLRWISEDGATEVHAGRTSDLLGRAVCITPMANVDGHIHVDGSFTGVVEKAEEKMGFVRYTLRGEDGQSFEVPFFNKYQPTSYVGVVHGHTLRELNDESFQPAKDYRGLVVFARGFRGGPEANQRSVGPEANQRSVDTPAVGKVVDQDENSVTLRTAKGEMLRYEKPAAGFLQVVTVPSTALSAEGSPRWQDAFEDLGELAGQFVHLRFDPVSAKSSVEAKITGFEQDASGLRLKYQLAEGLDAESNYLSAAHVIALPSTTPRKISKGDAAVPSFLGQVVTAKLVDESVHSAGYGAQWWKEQELVREARGVVVDQTDQKLVIKATNGETKVLDLAPMSGPDGLKGTFHDISAKSFILVEPSGLWAVKAE